MERARNGTISKTYYIITFDDVPYSVNCTNKWNRLFFIIIFVTTFSRHSKQRERFVFCISSVNSVAILTQMACANRKRLELHLHKQSVEMEAGLNGKLVMLAVGGAYRKIEVLYSRWLPCGPPINMSRGPFSRAPLKGVQVVVEGTP